MVRGNRRRGKALRKVEEESDSDCDSDSEDQDQVPDGPTHRPSAMLSQATRTRSKISAPVLQADISVPKESHEIRVLPVSMILQTDFDLTKNASIFKVLLFNDEKVWISEQEAKVNCPKKLEAYKAGKDNDEVEEDRDYIQLLNSSAKKSQGVDKVRLSHIPSGKFSAKTKNELKAALLRDYSPPGNNCVDSITKSSGKKKSALQDKKAAMEEEEATFGFGGLTSGNDAVMGKKRKRGEAQEDQQQSDISEDNPKNDARYYRALKKKVVNKANERLVRDYKETMAPDNYKHRKNLKQ